MKRNGVAVLKAHYRRRRKRHTEDNPVWKKILPKDQKQTKNSTQFSIENVIKDMNSIK